MEDITKLVVPRLLGLDSRFSHRDDRGSGNYDIFRIIQSACIQVDFNAGQFNLTKTYPGAIRAWHMHNSQADIMVVVEGNAIIAGFKKAFRSMPRREDETFSYVVGEDNMGIVIIPPGWWHGLRSLDGCKLLYYTTQRYDPDCPDEKRLPYLDHHPELLEIEIK